MVTFTVTYPCQEDGFFDMDYYCNNHLMTARRYFGDSCKSIVVIRAVKGYEDYKPDFEAQAILTFNSADEFVRVMEPADAELTDDVANFTNIEPLFQISEITMDEKY